MVSRWLDECVWAVMSVRRIKPDLTKQLSTNFSLAEMIRSGTAQRKGIDNTPGLLEVTMLERLCLNVLQPARDRWGSIHVNSGFRCPKLNRVIGGDKNSDHLHGRAADIVPSSGVSLLELGEWIQGHCEFKQLIYEHGEWLHVSFDIYDNRQEVLEAYREGRRVRYRPFQF